MADIRATMQDVAQAAGVSKMTVSRALRGERGIAKETRAKILALAESMGYRQDPAVTELMGQLRKSKLSSLEPIAWLTTYKTIGGWKSNRGTSEIYRGAAEMAHKLGYRLVEFSLNTPGMSSKRISSILYNQSIRGIVVAPLYQHGVIEDFSWQHFATVCCGPSLLQPKLHRVALDQFAVHRLGWNTLKDYGYRRIGLCVSATDNARVGYRWQASQLVADMLSSGHEMVPPMITDDWRPEVFLDWYQTHRPDVVYSLSDVYHWMAKANIRVPEDCGFALLRLDRMANIAGVDHHFGDIGAAAVALVASELHTNQYGIPDVRKTVAIESHWVHGATVRKA